MIRKYPHLCSPITIGNVTFRNRMFGAPLGGTDITHDCCVGRSSVGFYEMRAKGGAAAVTISECVVHPETDRSHMFRLDDNLPGSLASFTFTADAIRRHGAVPSIELSHGGMYAGSYILERKPGENPVKYSSSPGVTDDGFVIKELTKEQISDIVKSYGRVAGLAKRAGFEMVMIHGGHSWLINQFLSDAFNRRTDKYGGSFENRCRFMLEVTDSVRAAVGPGFPIEFRMSGAEGIAGGYGLETGIEIAKVIDGKVDLIHVSAGSHHSGFAMTHPPMFSPRGVNVKLAAEIKKHVKTPVATIGGLIDPAMMEDIIATGKADVVYMGRALLADPEIPWKIMEGREDETVKCLRCFTCMAERVQTQTRRCTLNPFIGRETEGFEIQAARNPKKVLIAGGGPGGLRAALTAAMRGHEVILCEKEARLGGILNCERDVPFKREMYDYTSVMEKLLRKEGVDIRLNTEVTKDYAEKQNADVLICAIGSTPIVPPLPGINGADVVLVNDLPERRNDVKDSVVVLGGGLAGCEAAVHFADEGKTVTVVEMRDTLAPDANVRHRPILIKKLEDSVKIELGLTGLRVEAEGLVCAKKDGSEALIPGKTVVCAVGQRPRAAEAKALCDAAPRVYYIGDCSKVQNMTAAIYQGHHAAKDI
ncbi:MAG: FAD-dependent oxidoreductase [Oscillospiraceae bacterium]|nr:FAD-dependent oxidoreductase [Oscillospiraceae bacterium]